jgi:hypothetical protein
MNTVQQQLQRHDKHCSTTAPRQQRDDEHGTCFPAEERLRLLEGRTRELVSLQMNPYQRSRRKRQRHRQVFTSASTTAAPEEQHL